MSHVTLSVVDAEHIVACDPPAAVAAMQRYADGAEVMAQRGNNLGDRIRHAFEDTFRLGTTSVVVIGSDLPDLPPRLLAEAFAALEADGTLVVIGPATDGGYYLIGMSRPRPPCSRGLPGERPQCCNKRLTPQPWPASASTCSSSGTISMPGRISIGSSNVEPMARCGRAPGGV